MAATPKPILCDGCGLPATPEHIASRIERLELATRFRPIHIGVLFIALSPAFRLEDDFYMPAGRNEFLDPLFEALGIPVATGIAHEGTTALLAGTERLTDFQKRGYFLAYLSECPLPESGEPARPAIARLSPNLLRRIRFNYKPKHIGLLGEDLAPLTQLLGSAGIGPELILNQGLPLPLPRTGAADWKALFQRAVATVSPS